MKLKHIMKMKIIKYNNYKKELKDKIKLTLIE